MATMIGQTFHAFSRDAMGATASVALHAAVLLFVIAAVIAIAGVLQPRRIRSAWADWTGIGATVALIVFFLARFAEAGLEPFSNLFEVVVLSVLCLAIGYLVATRVKPMPALGAFAYPALTIMLFVDLLVAGGIGLGEQGGSASVLLVVHVMLVLLSYAAFFLATIAAVMSLLQERALKQHKDSPTIDTFPPLEALRRLVNTSILAGLPLLTLGLILGFVALSSDGWTGIAANPKIPPSIVLWVVMVAVAGGRWAGVLHGRRHLYLVLVGFLLVLTTYVGLGVWSRSQSHAEVAALTEGR